MTVADIEVLIQANARQFQPTMQMVTGSLQGLEGMAARVGNGFKMLAGVAATYLGVNAVKSTMESIDATAKFSDQIGFATESLTAIEHAANLAGVEMGALHSALQIFVRRLAEAANGSGEAVVGLQSLGLSAQQLAQQGPEKAFESVVDRINKLPTALAKAQAAYSLFGRGGQGMINLLNEGNAAIDSARRKLQEFGASYSRLDARAVEEANDAFTDLGMALSFAAKRAAIELAPALKRVADSTVDLVKWFRELNNYSPVIWWGKWMVGIAAAVTLAPRIVSAIFAIAKAIKSITTGMAVLQALSGPKGWAVLAAGTAIAVGAVITIDKAFEDTVNEMQAVQDGANKAADGVTNLANAMNQTADATGRLQQEMAELARYQQEAQNIQKGVGDDANRLARDYELQTLTYGMNENAAQLMELKLRGVSDAMLTEVQYWMQQLEKLKAQERQQQFFREQQEKLQKDRDEVLGRIKQVGESVASPLDTYNKRMRELNDLMQWSLNQAPGTFGTMDWGTYDKAVLDAQRQYLEAMPQAPTKAGGLTTIDTQYVDVAAMQNTGDEQVTLLQQIKTELQKLNTNTRGGFVQPLR